MAAMFASPVPSAMPGMMPAPMGPSMWQQPAPMAQAFAPMGLPPMAAAPPGGFLQPFGAMQPLPQGGMVTPMAPAVGPTAPPAAFPAGFGPGARVQLRSVAADSRFAGKVFVVLPNPPDQAGQLRVQLEDGSMALSMSPQFLAPAGSIAEPQAAASAPPAASWIGGAQQPVVAANGLQPGDLVRFKGQVVNRTYEGKVLTVETADVGDGSGRARVMVQHENGQVARLAIDPSFLELVSQIQPEVASPITYQTVVAAGATYEQGLSEGVNPPVYQTVVAGANPYDNAPPTYQSAAPMYEPVSNNAANYQTVVAGGNMYEAAAPAPVTYQTIAHVPAVNAMQPQGPSMTTNASYLPAPAYTAAGAYGAGEVFNGHGTITPTSAYAPAPTYGTGATIGAAGEIGMPATGAWSYAPPPQGAYGAPAAPSTTYGIIANGATTTPAQYASPHYSAGGWSYAPPPLGAAPQPYPVA